MPKVMECPYCKKRFPSTTYEMFKHIEEMCEEIEKLNDEHTKLNDKYNKTKQNEK